MTWEKTWVAQKDALVDNETALMTAPIVRFHATTGTFSTDFGLVRGTDLLDMLPAEQPVAGPAVKPKGKKRVRIVEPSVEAPKKRARISAVGLDSSHENVSSEDSEESYSSSTSTSSDEDDVPLNQLSKTTVNSKAKAKAKAKRHKKAAPPTLLERLTGLTGDRNDPVYQPPAPKPQFKKTHQAWSERKKTRFNKQQRDRRYAESQDPVDKFKKLCCTLVIASSMGGGDGQVEWSIVEKVYTTKGFDLIKTKALWAWMRSNMAASIAETTAEFEARFLEAYEHGSVAAIENPLTYDWANLVRWALHSCLYPELSLPACREALQHFVIDLSSFEALDRPKWHREQIADRVRTQLQLQYPFTVPLHLARPPRSVTSDTELKARSWIRANTATPQALYDSKTAHEKLVTLGDPVLTKVVGEYVDRQMLRMRKLKRMLPGRNYTFTARLAKKYGRTFELSDFMAAVKVKKEMDTAFMHEDPEMRIYSISRAEPDGAIMAVMSLLNAGQVKFVPKVPSVNNEFGAPLPRLSVWGFMEGDYVHRGIDRQRLFWDIHVIPTSTYIYGNPLRPSLRSSLQEQTSGFKAWSALPSPLLPGKDDPNALLPIWSTMDGQRVIWPWWYRILNLVLQPLIFQPGATVEDIHANCDEYTTEIFEIQLALDWLVSVNAAKKTVGGGYITMPGVWAAFGDTLHDMDDDWLDAHVRRRHKKHEKQENHWRYSSLQGRHARQVPNDDDAESDTETDEDVATEVIAAPTSEDNTIQDKDVEMADAEGAHDVDAEGEMDV